MSDTIRQPGAWLESELTEAESAEVVEMLNVLPELDEEEDRMKAFDKIAPYMNTFMHLFYRLMRGKLGLKADDEHGVTDSRGREFDFVSYVINFIIDQYDTDTLAAMAEETDEKIDTLPRVRYNKGKDLKTSTDKLTNLFFSLAAPKTKGVSAGQREMIPLKYEHGEKSKEITLFYDYSFNEKIMKDLGLSLSFDSYDFFVSAVCDNLYLQGNNVVSLTKIWRAMDDGSSPSTKQLNELYESLVKGATTTMYLDDREVREAWGIDTSKTYNEIISPVMPLQIKGEKFKSNGAVANAQVVINNLSPFFALSQSIGHYTTWNKDILTMYTGKRTKRYYRVLHFLMIQIGWLRNPISSRSNKITYKSLYAYTGDKTTRARQLARDMAYRLLDEVFIPAGYVKSYKEDNKGEPGIVLKCTKNVAAALPSR